jgi:hypothetical protein
MNENAKISSEKSLYKDVGHKNYIVVDGDNNVLYDENHPDYQLIKFDTFGEAESAAKKSALLNPEKACEIYGSVATVFVPVGEAKTTML